MTNQDWTFVRNTGWLFCALALVLIGTARESRSWVGAVVAAVLLTVGAGCVWAYNFWAVRQ